MTDHEKPKDELLAELQALRSRVAELESEARGFQRVEKALRASEGQFRQLAESLPQLVWTCSADGPCDYLSPQWMDYTGISEADQLGLGWLEQLHPEDRNRTIETWNAAVGTGAFFDMEFRIRRRDGTYRWFKTRALPLRDGQGRMAKWFGTNTDITERKQQELQLRILSDMAQAVVAATTLDDTLQRILETITTGLGWEWSAIWDMDEQANVLRCSAIWHGSSLRVTEFEALTRRITFPMGIGLPGRVWASGDHVAVPDVCVDPNFPRAAAAVKEGLHGAFAFPILVDNKIIGIMELFSTQVRVADSHELTMLTNISSYVGQLLKQRRAEEALRLREQHLRAIIDTSPECIMLVAAEGTLLQMNAGGLRMIDSVSAEQVVGSPIYPLIAPEHREAFKAFNERTCAGHQGQLEFEIVGLRGTRRHMEAHAVPLQRPGESTLVTLAVARDTSERKSLEAQLRQAQKMEAVGRLAGGIAHDFNNLLTVISGYAHLLLLALTPSSPLHHEAAEISRAGERAAQLTRQLLAFSRKQVLQPEVLDLNASVTSLCRMLTRLLGEDIVLVLDLSPALGLVKIDPGQLEQVIMNLAVNARDAMPKGGTLTIATANAEWNERAGEREDSSVTLTVSDTGIGMDAETQSHIFEPFFTTKEVGKGTGLGLPMVEGIIKQSGGALTVSSEPGRGTSFTISLPRVQETISRGTSGQTPTGLPCGSETILLVDDDEMLLPLAERLLQEQGYRVLACQRSSEALTVCGQHSGPIHLVLTDVVMPCMSGRELAEAVAVRHPAAKVLYMSGYARDIMTTHGIVAPGVALLQKPFSSESLARKVREVLDAREDEP